MQARIWEIIRRTGYSPNKTARNLKLGQSAELRDPDPKSIACVYARTHTDMSDPFFSQIVKALELEAIKSRYFIRYSFTSQDLGRPETAAQLTQFPADGIVFSAVTTSGCFSGQQSQQECCLHRPNPNGFPVRSGCL